MLQPDDIAKAQGFLVRVDLGQILIMAVISLVGYAVKRLIDGITKRLDIVEERLFDLAGEMQRIGGQVELWNGTERRRHRGYEP